VGDYDGNCAGCIVAGYNYCNDDATCMDNFDNHCFTVFEFPTYCGGWYECADITINDADVFDLREKLYAVSSGDMCTITIVN